MRNALIALMVAVGLTSPAQATAQPQPAPASPDKPPSAPTPEQVQSFIAGHPDIFARRKIFGLDQVVVRNNLSSAVSQQIGPAKTVDQVVAVLTANNIEFTRGNNRLDTVGTDPRLIDQLLKLTSDDLFAVPVGETLTINKIVGVEIVPFTGEAANRYANLLLSGKPPLEAARDAAPAK